MRWDLTIAALFLALPAQAQSDRDYEEMRRVAAMVEPLAFDPSFFFDWRISSSFSSIRIRYRSYGKGPFYSISIADGCVLKDAQSPGCSKQRIARMVRAPRGARGGNLIDAIRKAGAKNEAQVRAVLDKAEIEWLEADVLACPGAMAALSKALALRWGPYQNKDGEDFIVTVSHSDEIEVTHTVPAGEVTWSGPALEGTPAEWAEEVAKVLEPCWKPVTAPPPWRRPRWVA